MKRIMTLLLALLLAAGMTGALATGTTVMTEPTIEKDGADIINSTSQPAYSDKIDQSLVFTKNYTTVGESPAIEFTFTTPVLVSFNDNNNGVVTGNALSAMDNKPTLTLNSQASYLKGAYTENNGKKNVTISVGNVTNNTHVGVYKFSFNEVNSHVAGVTYDETTHYIYVTVMRNEDDKKYYVVTMHNADNQNAGSKVNYIANSFASGTLKVAKQVTGNMADVKKYFKFTVTMTAPSGTTIDHTGIDVSLDGSSLAKSSSESPTDYSDINVGQKYRLNGDTYTFYLKHGQTITFANVPANVTYTVDEAEDGYDKEKSAVTTQSGANADSKIESGETETATFTNKKVADVDTGITLDSLPYILLLAAVALGAALLMARRRRHNED